MTAVMKGKSAHRRSRLIDGLEQLARSVGVIGQAWQLTARGRDALRSVDAPAVQECVIVLSEATDALHGITIALGKLCEQAAGAVQAIVDGESDGVSLLEAVLGALLSLTTSLGAIADQMDEANTQAETLVVTATSVDKVAKADQDRGRGAIDADAVKPALELIGVAIDAIRQIVTVLLAIHEHMVDALEAYQSAKAADAVSDASADILDLGQKANPSDLEQVPRALDVINAVLGRLAATTGLSIRHIRLEHSALLLLGLAIERTASATDDQSIEIDLAKVKASANDLPFDPKIGTELGITAALAQLQSAVAKVKAAVEALNGLSFNPATGNGATVSIGGNKGPAGLGKSGVTQKPGKPAGSITGSAPASSAATAVVDKGGTVSLRPPRVRRGAKIVKTQHRGTCGELRVEFDDGAVVNTGCTNHIASSATSEGGLPRSAPRLVRQEHFGRSGAMRLIFDDGSAVLSTCRR
jgi:hypothetical protein